MIKNSKQNWVEGQIVKVGFLQLKVTGEINTYNRNFCQPDGYILTSLDGSKKYEFIPHNGLHRID